MGYEIGFGDLTYSDLLVAAVYPAVRLLNCTLYELNPIEPRNSSQNRYPFHQVFGLLGRAPTPCICSFVHRFPFFTNRVSRPGHAPTECLAAPLNDTYVPMLQVAKGVYVVSYSLALYVYL